MASMMHEMEGSKNVATRSLGVVQLRSNGVTLGISIDSPINCDTTTPNVQIFIAFAVRGKLNTERLVIASENMLCGSVKTPGEGGYVVSEACLR
jgi:hypothetical protein